MTNKEHNFISAVVCVECVDRETLLFLNRLSKEFKEHFLKYEMLIVNRFGAATANNALKKWAEAHEEQVTVINMPSWQPHEQCMNAGTDLAIGDYVYEFDSAKMTYPANMIWRAYETAMKGNDIVAVCPKHTRLGSKLFYALFNTCCNKGNTMRTEAFRLVSRRAINRVHGMSGNLPYRKAAYALSGLKSKSLEFSSKKKLTSSESEAGRFDLAIDSLVLYTDFGYRMSIIIAIVMAVVAAAELAYTIIIYATGQPISGWTTTMFVLTLGLTGLFVVSIVVLKYLSLILRMIFQKQSYQIKGIDKY